MGKTQTEGKIVTRYLETFTNMPSLTLAKKIFAENPLDFGGVENVRSLIRVYRGATGAKARDAVKDKRFFNTGKIAPPEEAEDYPPVVLPKSCNNIGVISDIHIPNHRIKPIELAYNYFEQKEVNTILINGDLLDNTPFTRHEGKRPSASDVRRWFDQTEYFLELLRERFPTQTIYWLEGNHDYWYKRWMNQHAWQLDDDPYFSLQERLHIDEYKVKFIPQERYLLAGKLIICHGHVLAGKWGMGVAPARNLFNKTKGSVLIGHVHKSDVYTETDISGKIFTCWTTGCMCTLSPVYQAFGGKANFGFAHVTVEKNGDYHVQNLRIANNKVL